jgi:hypothetical protein
VHAGIYSGAKIAEILKKEKIIYEKWYEAAEKMKAAIERNFWKKTIADLSEA